ncbi:hypothetical protein JW756_01260 [Candidatus Woesearchaeota archaeon]|nr:hypothetical protein [Candidatus Woesearchaeota archaeon]
MAIEFILPFGRESNVKNLVFSILTKEYPLKIIELTNFIRKRYGKSVTFQAVRKAVLELLAANVLVRERNEFSLNRKWVAEVKKTVDELYESLNKDKATPKKVDSIGGEVSVFTFDSIAEMMKFWEDIIDNWFLHFKKGDYNMNSFQGAHGWEGLLYPDREKKMMGMLKHKGIKSYALSSGGTPLDKSIWKFYESIGLKVHLYPSSNYFERNYYVATYGEFIVQAHYPPTIVEELDEFFKKSRDIENLNLQRLSDIVNKKVKVKLTVIKNLEMAKQINNSILSPMKL